jgi:transposase
MVLVDLDQGKLIGLIKKGQIKEVSIDMWKPYKKVAEKLMPQGEIVADRFPVIQVNEELDRQRKILKREANSGKNSPEKPKILSGLNQSK